MFCSCSLGITQGLKTRQYKWKWLAIIQGGEQLVTEMKTMGAKWLNFVKAILDYARKPSQKGTAHRVVHKEAAKQVQFQSKKFQT